MLTVHEKRKCSENLSLVSEKDKMFNLNIQIDDSCVRGHVYNCFVVTIRNVIFFSVFLSFFSRSFLSPFSFSLPLSHMKRDIHQSSGEYFETCIFTKMPLHGLKFPDEFSRFSIKMRLRSLGCTVNFPRLWKSKRQGGEPLSSK